MRVLVYLTLVLCAIVAANTRALGQQPVSNETLFAQLQADATTDNALKQFLKRTPQDSDAQKYLATHLPEQILQGPQADHARVWVNEVHLAGAFRIEEAIPALVKWMDQPIGLPEGQTLSSVENLITVPAGQDSGTAGTRARGSDCAGRGITPPISATRRLAGASQLHRCLPSWSGNAASP
jgi:hypothetical protein